jgi:hypothetical protein
MKKKNWESVKSAIVPYGVAPIRYTQKEKTKQLLNVLIADTRKH